MNILVVGGAGYIGSHMVKKLVDNKFSVTVIDDLSSGHREHVRGAKFIKGNFGNKGFVADVLESEGIEAVMHFASFIEVGESVSNPSKYYQNNCVHTLALLDAMVLKGVEYFIFSSTAAIFGEPEYTPIDEAHTKNPINPYGRTKYMVEQILGDYSNAYGLKSISLRYFNASGADPEGELGESHDPETHLIPLVLQAASGRRKSVKIYGTDYETSDGTCVRDFVHVDDLVTAHLLALEYLVKGGRTEAFNLGTNSGYTVREVIETVQEITGVDFEIIEEDKRAGDPAILVANSSLANELLNWEPQFSDLKSIVQHAWDWEQKLFETRSRSHNNA